MNLGSVNRINRRILEDQSQNRVYEVVCVCWWGRGYMCLWCVYMEVRDWHQESFLYHFPSYLLRQDLPLNLEFACATRLAGWRAHPSSGVTGAHHHSWLLYGCWGVKPSLCCDHFTTKHLSSFVNGFYLLENWVIVFLACTHSSLFLSIYCLLGGIPASYTCPISQSL